MVGPCRLSHRPFRPRKLTRLSATKSTPVLLARRNPGWSTSTVYVNTNAGRRSLGTITERGPAWQGSSFLAKAEQFRRVPGGDYAGVAMALQSQQVPAIARDQIIGSALLGHGEQEIVGWVGTDADLGQGPAISARARISFSIVPAAPG
jgi:hypothetical protein